MRTGDPREPFCCRLSAGLFTLTADQFPDGKDTRRYVHRSLNPSWRSVPESQVRKPWKKTPRYERVRAVTRDIGRPKASRGLDRRRHGRARLRRGCRHLRPDSAARMGIDETGRNYRSSRRRRAEAPCGREVTEQTQPGVSVQGETAGAPCQPRGRDTSCPAPGSWLRTPCQSASGSPAPSARCFMFQPFQGRNARRAPPGFLMKPASRGAPTRFRCTRCWESSRSLPGGTARGRRCSSLLGTPLGSRPISQRPAVGKGGARRMSAGVDRCGLWDKPFPQGRFADFGFNAQVRRLSGGPQAQNATEKGLTRTTNG